MGKRDFEGVICDPEALADRPLLSVGQADALAATFKVLANEGRLRVLHALARAGEVYVGDLAAQVDMSMQAVSNQLQRLADRGVVGARREGNFVWYRIEDPCVSQMLELGLCLNEEAGQPVLVRQR